MPAIRPGFSSGVPHRSTTRQPRSVCLTLGAAAASPLLRALLLALCCAALHCAALVLFHPAAPGGLTKGQQGVRAGPSSRTDRSSLRAGTIVPCKTETKRSKRSLADRGSSRSSHVQLQRSSIVYPRRLLGADRLSLELRCLLYASPSAGGDGEFPLHATPRHQCSIEWRLTMCMAGHCRRPHFPALL